jgi:hypothetical protein
LNEAKPSYLVKCKSWILSSGQSTAERDFRATVEERKSSLRIRRFPGETSLSGSLWGPRLSNKKPRHSSPWPWRLRGSATVAAATILTTSTHPIPCHSLGHPHRARGSFLHVDCVLVAPLGDQQDTRLTFSTRRLNGRKEAASRINPLTRKTRADLALTKITRPPIQKQKKMRGSKGVWA